MNQNIKTVLLYAKEKNKWVCMKHLVPHGMHTGIYRWLLEKDYIHTKQSYEHGTQIKLTLEGYKALKGEEVHA
jgi:hypothetical protein